MVTEIGVHKTGERRSGKRRWLRGPHGTEPGTARNVAIDFTKFTGANFADGYIDNGCVLGIITATNKVGPYEPAATDGRQTARGVLFNDVKIPANTATVASDAMLVHFFCDAAQLPYQTGLGALDAAARTALRGVMFD